MVLCARTARELHAVASAIRAGGGDVIARATDIGSARQARALASLAIRRHGRIDVLINNAGILGPRVPIIRYPLRAWTEVLRVNLSSTFSI